jgi:thiol-disulfide isomerase/thioredoxin
VNKRLQAGLFMAVAVLAGAAGFYLSRGTLVFQVADGAGESLMRVPFPDLGGKPRSLAQWRGKVLVVNFWATWCVPCRDEIPALMKAQQKYAANSVQIVGIAIDYASKVRDYANEMRIDYPLLISGMESIGISKGLGNHAGVLPYTVIFDRSGRVAYAHAGALTESTLGTALAPLL